MTISPSKKQSLYGCKKKSMRMQPNQVINDDNFVHKTYFTHDLYLYYYKHITYF